MDLDSIWEVEPTDFLICGEGVFRRGIRSSASDILSSRCPIRLSGGSVKEAIGYGSLELRGEVRAGVLSLGISRI